MRILIIPAVPNTPLRQRAAELAVALGERHRVVVLFGERQPAGLAVAAKLLWHARQALTFGHRRLAPRVTGVRLPALPRWPRLSRRYQGALLALLARLWRLDAVVTESTGEVRAPSRRGTRIVFDLLDDHAAGEEQAGRPNLARAIREFMGAEIRRAVAVTASSRVLARVVKAQYGRDAVLVPNGVRCRQYRSVRPEEIEALRTRYGLGVGPILGFTGGVDAWVEAGLVVAALRVVQRARPTAALLVVGDGARAREFRGAGADGVVTGFVPPDLVPAHVALFDVGLVPFNRSRLTDAMLPIKIFDYAAARKPVVSTSLEAYAGEDLPFLTVADASPDALAAAILAALDRGWDPAWDRSVDRYDWQAVVQPLERLLGG